MRIVFLSGMLTFLHLISTSLCLTFSRLRFSYELSFQILSVAYKIYASNVYEMSHLATVFFLRNDISLKKNIVKIN